MPTHSSEFQAIFRDTQIHFARFYSQTLARSNMTFPQFLLLTHLFHAGCLQMNELAKRLVITTPAVTHLVDRLEREGFAKRRAHPKDRRVTLIEITPQGKTLTAKTQGKILELLTRCVRGFSASERDAIKRFYAKLGQVFTQELRSK